MKSSELELAGGDNNEGGGELTQLVNLNEDKALSGVLKYNIGMKQVYSIGSKAGQGEGAGEIVIGGMGVMSKHAKISRGGGDGELSLTSLVGARTVLNGEVLAERVGVRIKHNDRLIFGNNSVFRVDIPSEQTKDGIAAGDIDWEFAMQEANGEMMKQMRQAAAAEDKAAEQVSSGGRRAQREGGGADAARSAFSSHDRRERKRKVADR